MKKQKYQVEINAAPEVIFDRMFDKESYSKWTAAFNPTSHYEGSFEKGSKVLFLGIDENGKKGGMVSEIEEKIPNEFLSIRHYGLYNDGVEVTEGPEVASWAGGHENYTLVHNESTTTVIVEVDVTEDHIDYFDKTFPLAFQKLKEMCES